MKYTVYLSYKKTRHIGSPSQQLQFPTPVVYYKILIHKIIPKAQTNLGAYAVEFL